MFPWWVSTNLCIFRCFSCKHAGVSIRSHWLNALFCMIDVICVFSLPLEHFLTLNHTCVSRCPSGTFGNKTSGQCDPCLSGCVVCQEAQACQRCLTGLYLQNGTCVVECQRCRPSHLLFYYLHKSHSMSLLAVTQWFGPLSASSSEGSHRVKNATNVPRSVDPAKNVLPTVWAVRDAFCCWTTPACPPVQRATMTTAKSACAAHSTVASAVRMASARVSRNGECGEKDCRHADLKGIYFRAE